MEEIQSYLPAAFRKVVGTKLSSNFREATQVMIARMPQRLRPTEALVQNIFVGVNASDINLTAGVYKPGAPLPMECGFEALGKVVGKGSSVNVPLGSAVLTQSFGAFAEYQLVPMRSMHVVPSIDKRFLPLEISGVTASMCLETQASPVRGETALVTAAAGGTGIFAVQILKHIYGCHVVGTCGSDEKVAVLKGLGCDRAINYKEENLDSVLTREYPHGINLVYESVGGDQFSTCLSHLAVKGRLVVVGSIVGYRDGSAWKPATDSAPPRPIGPMLLQKSASIRSFFLPHYQKYHAQHFDKLMDWMASGKVQSVIDPKPFQTISSVVNAVEHLHSGKNIGKVIVDLC